MKDISKSLLSFPEAAGPDLSYERSKFVSNILKSINQLVIRPVRIKMATSTQHEVMETNKLKLSEKKLAIGCRSHCAVSAAVRNWT